MIHLLCISNSQYLNLQQMQAYKIGQKIGQGSFGKVYKAIHRLTNISVCVKIIKKQQLVTAQLQQSIRHEIEILKRLKHPNIAQLFQVIEDKKYIYLVLEHAQKGDLVNILKTHGVFTESQTSNLIFQILSTVKYLHEQGIAHRDIKLANILLSSDNQIKIIDFGLSKQYQAGEKLKSSCGSPCFAAPQLIRQIQYDPVKSDIWSIGIVGYCLIEETLPFYHYNISKLYKLVEKGKYRKMQTNNKQAHDFIKKMLQINPYKRLSFEAAIQHAFIQKRQKQSASKKQKKTVQQQKTKQRIIKQIIKMIYGKKEIISFGQEEDAALSILRTQNLRKLSQKFKQLKYISSMGQIQYGNKIQKDSRKIIRSSNKIETRLKSRKKLQRVSSIKTNSEKWEVEKYIKSDNNFTIFSLIQTAKTLLSSDSESKNNSQSFMFKETSSSNFYCQNNYRSYSNKPTRSFYSTPIAKKNSDCAQNNKNFSCPYNLKHTVKAQNKESIIQCLLRSKSIQIQIISHQQPSIVSLKYCNKIYKIQIKGLTNISHRFLISSFPHNSKTIQAVINCLPLHQLANFNN